jgi:hypothetical protein
MSAGARVPSQRTAAKVMGVPEEKCVDECLQSALQHACMRTELEYIVNKRPSSNKSYGKRIRQTSFCKLGSLLR